MKRDIAELVKAAAAAAKHAPEHLQEVAFNKAFEALLDEQPHGNNAPASPRPSHKSRTQKQEKTEPLNDQATIHDLNRTEHPEIDSNSTGLMNSLRLLRAAKDTLGIDGLSATTIAEVLTEKFRFRISKQAVSEALNEAGRFVDRRKDGHKVLFRIMGPGEQHLDSPGKVASGPKPRRVAAKRNVSSKSREVQEAKTQVQSSDKKSAGKKSPAKSGTGSGASLSRLYESGYFKKPRSIADMLASLKHDVGRSFRANELSPHLLRRLRNGSLKRSKNAEGQYEYSQA